MNRPKLALVSLSKEYDGGQVVAVDNIDLEIEAGETLALLGPSGCGKSTTLNMIVGLESPTSGDIQVDGKSVVNTPPGQRDIGLVFQDYAVFTSMTVRKNLAFGLSIRGIAPPMIDREVEAVAELLGMSDRLDVRAGELGGSELQRVAIGRTLITQPSILLLDEPLSNLETAARLAMRRELRRLQGEIGLTIIYVTHDQIEALSLANRIAVMSAGRILQVEDAAIIIREPEHVFVAGFLGSPSMNLYRGKLKRHDDGVLFANGEFSLDVGGVAACAPTIPAQSTIVGIRPECVRITSPENAPIVGRVNLVEPRGPEVVLTIDIGTEQMKVVAPTTDVPRVGESVGFQVDPDTLTFFDGDTNKRIEFLS